ncbi:MAG: hypothetical protein E6P95_03005 [Candidatus Moraniibacteriota bacterium]|nr:MAG: hypothetical protein E6P95_03005 [Candidatus Moranbacteria bacterium]
MFQLFPVRGWRDASVGVLLIALLLGLWLPMVFGPLQVYSTLCLQVVFFLSSLQIDIRGIWNEWRAWSTWLLVTLWMLILLPAALFSIVQVIFPDLALPLLLLAAMPVGMTTPLLAQILRLNGSLALILTLTTSLLAPITVPLLLGLFADPRYAIEIGHVFLTLFQVIIIPFALAQIVKLFLPGFTRVTKRWYTSSSIILVGIIIASIAGHYQSALLSRFTFESGLGLLVLMLFFLITHVIGYWIVWWRNEQDRLTVTFSVVYMNFTLAIFIAEKFFGDPTVIFYTILAILPWNIGMFFFQKVVNHRFSLSTI